MFLLINNNLFSSLIKMLELLEKMPLEKLLKEESKMLLLLYKN